MAKAGSRVKITLRCSECKQRNYNTNKNKRNTTERLELNKYCPFCRKHTAQRKKGTRMSELNKRDEVVAGKESVSSADKKAKTAAKKKDKKPNRLARWVKDLKGELKKVTWPSGKDTLKNVGTVIVCVLLVGVFIWVFDWIARQVVEALLKLFA